jgi:hypothetical protein
MAQIAVIVNPRVIRLFETLGVRLNETQHLLIVKDTDERPIDRRVAVRRLVYDSRCRIPFSPLVLTPAEIARRLESGDQFLAEILDKGEVLYVRS